MLDQGMNEIELRELEMAIAEPIHRPGSRARLTIQTKPEPFVAPTLTSSDTDPQSLFSVEVVFVEASAAVGKSWMAAFLSSSRNIPLLNLANVRVSTNSLVGLLQSDFSGSDDPIQAFHDGRLPVIIDALDEGRLLSGEQHFDSFVETTGELLLQNRRITDRPKIILFGRHESAEQAGIWLELAGIKFCSVEVGFFDEPAAREMIDVYARTSVRDNAAYLQHSGPVRDLVDAYFSAIESALGLDQGELWADGRGRAFAGYAPVLAAIGFLLAEMENFKGVANQLRSGGNQEAWEVIETVLQEILDREKGILCKKLPAHFQGPVPDRAYDPHEQLTFLTQYVHGQNITASSRVPLTGSDQATYLRMVSQHLQDHAFIRHGELTNVVLGSIVLAHAVNEDLLQGANLQLIEDSSRQPFLWRSLRKQLSNENCLIDGRYVGCVLNSFWNDPVAQNPKVIIRSTADGASATVRLFADGISILEFNITLPLTLYGQIRDSDIDIQGAVTLKGQARQDSALAFSVYGATTVICDDMEVSTDSISFGGKIWFEAVNVSAPTQLDFHMRNGTKVGWGGGLTGNYPWNQFPSVLAAPYPLGAVDLLTNMVEECRLRLPGGPIILSEDLTPVSDEPRMQWAVRRFRTEFPRFFEILVEHGLASTEQIAPSGTVRKTRVRMNISWSDLRNALQNPGTAPNEVVACMDAARRIFVD